MSSPCPLPPPHSSGAPASSHPPPTNTRADYGPRSREQKSQLLISLHPPLVRAKNVGMRSRMGRGTGRGSEHASAPEREKCEISSAGDELHPNWPHPCVSSASFERRRPTVKDPQSEESTGGRLLSRSNCCSLPRVAERREL